MDHVEEHPRFDQKSIIGATGEPVSRHTKELSARSKVNCYFASIETFFKTPINFNPGRCPLLPYRWPTLQ